VLWWWGSFIWIDLDRNRPENLVSKMFEHSFPSPFETMSVNLFSTLLKDDRGCFRGKFSLWIFHILFRPDGSSFAF
jgi:hypothetical protein